MKHRPVKMLFARASLLVLLFPLATLISLWLLARLGNDLTPSRWGPCLPVALIVAGCAIPSIAGTFYGIREWTCESRRHTLMARMGAILNILVVVVIVLFFIAMHWLADNFNPW